MSALKRHKKLTRNPNLLLFPIDKATIMELYLQFWGLIIYRVILLLDLSLSFCRSPAIPTQHITHHLQGFSYISASVFCSAHMTHMTPQLPANSPMTQCAFPHTLRILKNTGFFYSYRLK